MNPKTRGILFIGLILVVLCNGFHLQSAIFSLDRLQIETIIYEDYKNIQDPPEFAARNGIINGDFESWASPTQLNNCWLQTGSTVFREANPTYVKEGQFSAKLNGNISLNCQEMSQYTTMLYFEGWIFDNNESWDVTIHFNLRNVGSMVAYENVSTSGNAGWYHLVKSIDNSTLSGIDETTSIEIQQNVT